MDKSPLVSIVVLNWNGGEVLVRCISFLLKTNYPNFEIVVFDNGSTDESVDVVENEFGSNPRLKVIRSPVNLGITGGYNGGARYAKGQYIVFMNNDMYVKPDWLRELVKVMNSDPMIGSAQGKYITLGTPRKGLRQVYPVEMALDAFRSTFRRGIKNEGKQVKEIFYAAGSAMIVRRKVFKEVEGFDPDFIIMDEDPDLGWRIRLRGYRSVFVPTSIFHHVGGGGGSLGRISANKAFHGTKNRIAMLIKNYELKNLAMYFPVAFVIIFGTIIFAGKSVDRLRGLLWTLVNFRKIWIKRLKVKYFVRKTPDSQLKQIRVIRPLFGPGTSTL